MSLMTEQACEYGLGNDCPANEECVPKNNRAKTGHCKCTEGYSRNPQSSKCQKNQGILFTSAVSHPIKTQDNSPLPLLRNMMKTCQNLGRSRVKLRKQ